MPNDLTSIQLHRSTVERLQALKVPGLTYEDVINLALNHLPRREVERLYREWLDTSFAKLVRHPGVRPAKRSRKTR